MQKKRMNSKASAAEKHADKNRKAKNRRPRIGRFITVCADVLAASALILCGYAGNISPLKYGGAWGVLHLAFPGVLAIVALMLIVQLFTCRRGAAVLACGMVLSGGPLLTYFPLNIHFGDRQPSPGDSTFTLMSYNVANLIDQRPITEQPMGYNAIVSQILSHDADIVCLSESRYLSVSERLNITPVQYDSLQRRYPHIILSGRAQCTLSKYPIQPLHTSMDSTVFGAADVGMYRVTLPGGKLLTLFNVHLQSLGLRESDKNLYVDLTELKTEDLGQIRRDLLGKVSAANVQRARQTQILLGLIRHYGGPNVIVCGDFNDVPGSYPVRSFADAGFQSVYPKIGFGPIITFNADRFYFCIDHVLYRGDLVPLNIHKGTEKCSDHYPLTVRFEVL